MPTSPDAYLQTVCTCLRHATPKEKAAVQAELAAHMDDHAAALVEAGYDESHARRQAVEAMGDPQEMGAALNREFPLRWLVLSRLALVLLLAVALYLCRFVPGPLVGAGHNLQARMDPTASSYHQTHVPPNFVPLDFRQTLSNGLVFSVYGLGLGPLESDDLRYEATVCIVVYSPNPFRSGLSLPAVPTFTCSGDSDPLSQTHLTSTHSGARYYDFSVCPEAGQEITLHYSCLGVVFDLPLELPWEEVLS